MQGTVSNRIVFLKISKENRKDRKMVLEFEEMTERIIAAAIEVHKALIPGFLESIYENALSMGFKSRSISYKR